jgi:hypothetical protein
LAVALDLDVAAQRQEGQPELRAHEVEAHEPGAETDREDFDLHARDRSHNVVAELVDPDEQREHEKRAQDGKEHVPPLCLSLPTGCRREKGRLRIEERGRIVNRNVCSE